MLYGHLLHLRIYQNRFKLFRRETVKIVEIGVLFYFVIFNNIIFFSLRDFGEAVDYLANLLNFIILGWQFEKRSSLQILNYVGVVEAQAAAVYHRLDFLHLEEF